MDSRPIGSPEEAERWDLVLRSRSHWVDLQLADVWRYRDLLWLFVRRDFVAVYTQTILGPLWFFIQPLLTTIVFTVIFSGVAKIPTNGQPPMLFYLAGITPWNYFAACLNKTSSTFTANAGIFGKVYFPRLIAPLSNVVSTLIQFGIQFALFVGFLIYYAASGARVAPDAVGIIVATPLLLLIMGGLGLGFGLILSALTTRYRDLTYLVSFGVQLAMFGTPVIYPISGIPAKYRELIEANPMTPVIESFRTVYLEHGHIPWGGIGYAAGFTAVVLFGGIAIFNRVERTFMDTV